MYLKKLAFAAAIAAFSLPLASHAATIDFDDGVEGTVANGTVFGGLVAVSSPDPVNAPAALFNSNCYGSSCSGGDSDLATGPTYGTDPQGLVLVIEENPNTPGVDDDAAGGTLNFAFMVPVIFNSITLLDLDRDFASIMFTFFFGDGSSTTTGLPSDPELLGNRTGNNSLRRYDFTGLSDVTGFSFTTRDSGAIASIDITPVPLPAGLPLLLAGLGGLALLKRRKQATA